MSEDGTDATACGYCGSTALAYELDSDKGPLKRCIPCLAIEQGSQKLTAPFDRFVDFTPGHVYDTEDEKREAQKNQYESARSWFTILSRIQQDKPILKRDPEDFGTVHEWTRTFLTNIMGADAHKKPSAVAGDEVSVAQETLTEVEDGE